MNLISPIEKNFNLFEEQLTILDRIKGFTIKLGIFTFLNYL